VNTSNVPVQPASEAAPESVALRRGRQLEYFTILWNVVEAVVSVAAGLLAGSTALLGFGVDAVIETGSGATLLWRLQDQEGHERREAVALRLVGVSFLLLAVWVAYESAESCGSGGPPAGS
jgi:divalent metal cation (Fe/Co/Zn/Cd) transporter